MKSADFFWEHPLLTTYQRRVTAGAWLFQQNDIGDAMYIILNGYIALSGKTGTKAAILSLLSAGEFLGEQSLMSSTPYRRAFSAQAKTEVTVLRLTREDIESIQEKSPELMMDILNGMFGVATERLQKTNRLVQLLRSSRNTERFINLVLHLCETSSREFLEGKEIYLSKDTIRFYIDMSDFEIERCLQELERQKLMVSRGSEFFLIPNEKSLKGSVTLLEDSLPQLVAI